jgi:hypothetical protein
MPLELKLALEPNGGQEMAEVERTQLGSPRDEQTIRNSVTGSIAEEGAEWGYEDLECWRRRDVG